MKKFAWVVLALLLMLTAYFLRDEPLTPLAEQALNYQPASVPAEQNAFVGAVGINALTGRDFIQVGETYIQQSNSGQVPDEQNFDKRERIFKHSCIQEITEKCLSEIRADAENIQKLQKEEYELIQRYLKIQEMPNYSNQIQSPSIQVRATIMLPSTNLPYVSRILSAQAILDITNGRGNEGLNWIQKDMAFYRRIFAAKDADLLDKTIALIQIRRHVDTLNMLIGKENLRGHEKTLRALLVPLDSPKENIMNAAWVEDVFLLQTIYKTPFGKFDGADPQSRKPGYIEKWVVYFLYKQNMTANFAAKFMNHKREITIDETPASLLSSNTADETNQRTGCPVWRDSLLCKHLKNYYGEVLVHMGNTNRVNYFLRAYDTDACLRLARAQLEYKLAAKQPNADPIALLASLPPETFNPYTEKPFDFDAERGVIGFQPAANHDKDRRVEIHLPLQ